MSHQTNMTSIKRAITLLAIPAVLAASVLTSAPAQAATTTASAVAAQDPAPTQMTPTQWRALKAGLDSSKDFTHNVNVSSGVRTHTYTYTSGSAVVLQEPVGAVAASAPFTTMTPLPEGVGCGFLRVCVALNKTDQEALINGYTVLLIAAICAIPGVGWVGCAAIGAVVAVGSTYLHARGICPNKLRLTLFPPKQPPRCI